MRENRCVCCGEIIPEGKQVCQNCLVTVNNKPNNGCERCRDSAEMLITITNKVKDPNAKYKWLGGHLPARYCPFCGRKLRTEDG